MSKKTIPQLTAAAAANLTDLLEASQGGPDSVKLAISQIKTLFDTIYAKVGGVVSRNGNPVDLVSSGLVFDVAFPVPATGFVIANVIVGTNGINPGQIDFYAPLTFAVSSVQCALAAAGTISLPLIGFVNFGESIRVNNVSDPIAANLIDTAWLFKLNV